MAGRWTPSKQSAGFTATCTRSPAIAAAWRTVQEEGDVGYRGKSPEGEQRRCRSSLRRTSPIIILHAPPPAHEKGRETISLTFMAAPNSPEELRGERDVRRCCPRHCRYSPDKRTGDCRLYTRPSPLELATCCRGMSPAMIPSLPLLSRTEERLRRRRRLPAARRFEAVRCRCRRPRRRKEAACWSCSHPTEEGRV
nr:hypothetical protein Itr_chr05CG12380 [Ipomoea trifida]GLL27206.1 hypothetical protein Itr_chr05CG12390 [Ipomoea trifida]